MVMMIIVGDGDYDVGERELLFFTHVNNFPNHLLQMANVIG